MSALRRMRETDRPIAFKPWIYEIAKNACIDQFRRSKRAEEVSYDADEGLAAADYGRLVTTGPTPDVAVDQKMSLDHLCGAFGGLSETHHEILVMRELEGLSYREIGERLGMSRPSVESTLFRARRRLTEEYSELDQRRALPPHPGDHRQRRRPARSGARDQRRMARHVSYCQPCRRQARLAGLDSSVLVHTPGAGEDRRVPAAAGVPQAPLGRRRRQRRSGVGSGHAPTVAQWSSQVSDPSIGRLGQGRGHRRDDRHRRRRRRRCDAGRRRRASASASTARRRRAGDRAHRPRARRRRARGRTGSDGRAARPDPARRTRARPRAARRRRRA